MQKCNNPLVHSHNNNTNKVIRPQNSLLPPRLSVNTPSKSRLNKSQELNNRRVEAKTALTINQRRVCNEDLFDQFMEKSLTVPVHEALEPVLRIMFHGDTGILWIDQPENQALYSPSQRIKGLYTNSMPGFVFKTQSIIQIKDASCAPSGFIVDPRLGSQTSPMFFFPICDKAVIQIIRRSSTQGFNEADMECAQLLMHKFSIYGPSIFSTSRLIPLALNLFSNSPDRMNVVTMLSNHFQCGIVEIWKIDSTKNIGFCYDPSSREMVQRELNLVINRLVHAKTIVNDIHDKYGIFIGSTLNRSKNDIWCIICGNRKKTFNTSEESQLHAITPFVVKFITGFNSVNEQNLIASRLGELLNIFTLISFALTFEELHRVVTEQIASVFECEYAFVRFFSKKNPIPRSGLSKQVVESERVVSIEAPMDDEKYNPSIDSLPGVDPKSLIIAPIMTGSNNIAGLLYAINKKGGDAFEPFDISIAGSLASFIGASSLHCKRIKVYESLAHCVCTEGNIARILHKISKILQVRRLALYSTIMQKVSLVAETGEKADKEQELDDVRKNKPTDEQQYIKLIGSNDEDVGILVIKGSVSNFINRDDMEVFTNLLSGLLRKQEKQEVDLKYIIDVRNAASSREANNIDLGPNYLTHHFNIEVLDDIELYKIIFKIFGRFQLFDALSISNACLFNFIRQMNINKRSVSALQFVAFEIISTRLEKFLSTRDIFCLFLSAILSDFKSESLILEECSEGIENILKCINIMSNEETSLMRSIQPSDSKDVWSKIIELTTATDYANVFNIIKLFKTTETDYEEDCIKSKDLKLLIVCAKLGDCARANADHNVILNIIENFLKRADTDELGVEINRNDINPEKFVDIFFQKVIVPLFEILHSRYNCFSSVLDSIQENWKSIKY